LLLDWGLAYDATGQPQKALEKLTQAVVTVKGPTAAHDAAHAQTQIAKVFAGRRAWPQALAALEAAEKLDPTFPSIYVYRGLIHLANNDPAGAVPECRRAIALDANFQPAQDCLAQAQKMGAR
ncbi:MAG TPA: tetratricopeptide repeat protein, partial [Candidatus Solibacter sp.]|nr:tetratricopeptide repeat protein [Candidatus Solibacter sp.]